MPSIDAKTFAVLKPYLALGDKLGRFVAQLAPKRNDRLVITYGGKATEAPTESVTRAVLTGFFKTAGGEAVNTVNARAMAATLGVSVEGVQASEGTDFYECRQ